jgi:hypothetical protein
MFTLSDRRRIRYRVVAVVALLLGMALFVGVASVTLAAGSSTAHSIAPLEETPTETATKIPTDTPTEKPTEVPTKTPTVKPTDTPTEPPTETPTPIPDRCQFLIQNFDPCLDSNGCVIYSIPLRNQSSSPITVEGTIVLRDSNRQVIALAAVPPTTLPPNSTVFVDGTLCPDVPNVTPTRFEVLVRSADPDCPQRTRSRPIMGLCP